MSDITTRFAGIMPTMYQAYNFTIHKVQKVIIKPLDKGFVVKVGCKTIAVSSADLLIKHLTEYLKDPAGMEQKFNNNKLKF